MANKSLEALLQRLDAVKDTMTVSRVFGEAYHADGVMVIPVAAVRGGGGGGGGEGSTPAGHAADASTNGSTGAGGGVGFGVAARPVGVYVVKGDDVTWQPSIDVMRIVLGGQILGLVALFTLRKALSGRR